MAYKKQNKTHNSSLPLDFMVLFVKDRRLKIANMTVSAAILLPRSLYQSWNVCEKYEIHHEPRFKQPNSAHKSFYLNKNNVNSQTKTKQNNHLRLYTYLHTNQTKPTDGSISTFSTLSGQANFRLFFGPPLNCRQ